jgi:uncharacterized protein (TIGR02449 family)
MDQAMNSENALQHLESTVDELITTCQTLCSENQLLRAQLAQAQDHQRELLNKNASTTHQVKQIIYQLREHIS